MEENEEFGEGMGNQNQGDVAQSEGGEKAPNLCPFERKAMDSYDEDLSENPFLQSFLASCPELFSQCVVEQWLICVPRRDSLPKYAFTLEDFTHHILRPLGIEERERSKRRSSGESSCSSDGGNSSYIHAPSSCGSSFLSEDNCSSLLLNRSSRSDAGVHSNSPLKRSWNYQTLSHTNVELAGETLILDVEIPVDENGNGGESDNEQKFCGEKFIHLRKEILFDETFYTNDRRKYKVLCVASPLNSKADIEDEEFGNGSGLGIWNLTSLRDCIDFLWVKGGFKVLDNYDAYIKIFMQNQPVLETLPLTVQRNLVHALYLQCLDYAEGTGMANVPENPSLSSFLFRKLQLATETYILNGVYRPLISAITSVTAGEDAYINKITRNLHEIQPQDLGINTVYWNLLGRARQELSRIGSYAAPLGKISCVNRTLRHLRPFTLTDGSHAGLLSTDELIPILVYLIIKIPLGNWMAQLEFLRHFRFSASEHADNESSFYVVTLEASLEHLKSVKLGVNYEDEEDDESSVVEEPWLNILYKGVYETENSHLSQLLDTLRVGTYLQLQSVIEAYESVRHEHNKKLEQPQEQIDSELLCHPLCQCEKCASVYLSNEKEEPMKAAVELRTDQGHTLLHVACIFGKPKIVDFLIDVGSNLDAKDEDGVTPLHYAMSKGHQHIVLLLLHSGCALEPVDRHENTPLHLASLNGHEGCVKAVIYYAQHVGKSMNLSRGNRKGDTALHLSSRWGYFGIVNILTEHGAAIKVWNSHHATPIDVAHDSHILKILQCSLRRRSLVQLNHGDYVNIEMMAKEDSGGVVMLISEPAEEPEVPENPSPATSTTSRSRSNSMCSSRVPSRRTSTTTAPFPFLGTGSSPRPPRSRKISSIFSPFQDESIRRISEENTTERLKSVVEHLQQDQDPSSPDFVIHDVDEGYDPTEQDHLRRVVVEPLDDDEALCEMELKKERDIHKLFSTIAIGDLPLALFYLGIPTEELDSPENGLDHIEINPVCHPLCQCNRCIAKNSSLRLGFDIRNQEGLTPLHIAVQYHIPVLVRILIRYGADLNIQSTYEKKTALDFAIDRGYQDIESILVACGARPSMSFSLMTSGN